MISYIYFLHDFQDEASSVSLTLVAYNFFCYALIFVWMGFIVMFGLSLPDNFKFDEDMYVICDDHDLR
jgi:hypothetical protein